MNIEDLCAHILRNCKELKELALREAALSTFYALKHIALDKPEQMLKKLEHSISRADLGERRAHSEIVRGLCENIRSINAICKIFNESALRESGVGASIVDHGTLLLRMLEILKPVRKKFYSEAELTDCYGRVQVAARRSITKLCIGNILQRESKHIMHILEELLEVDTLLLRSAEQLGWSSLTIDFFTKVTMHNATKNDAPFLEKCLHLVENVKILAKYRTTLLETTKTKGYEFSVQYLRALERIVTETSWEEFTNHRVAYPELQNKVQRLIHTKKGRHTTAGSRTTRNVFGGMKGLMDLISEYIETIDKARRAACAELHTQYATLHDKTTTLQSELVCSIRWFANRGRGISNANVFNDCILKTLCAQERATTHLSQHLREFENEFRTTLNSVHFLDRTLFDIGDFVTKKEREQRASFFGSGRTKHMAKEKQADDSVVKKMVTDYVKHLALTSRQLVPNNNAPRQHAFLDIAAALLGNAICLVENYKIMPVPLDEKISVYELQQQLCTKPLTNAQEFREGYLELKHAVINNVFIPLHCDLETLQDIENFGIYTPSVMQPVPGPSTQNSEVMLPELVQGPSVAQNTVEKRDGSKRQLTAPEGEPEDGTVRNKIARYHAETPSQRSEVTSLSTPTVITASAAQKNNTLSTNPQRSIGQQLANPEPQTVYTLEHDCPENASSAVSPHNDPKDIVSTDNELDRNTADNRLSQNTHEIPWAFPTATPHQSADCAMDSLDDLTQSHGHHNDAVDSILRRLLFATKRDSSHLAETQVIAELQNTAQTSIQSMDTRGYDTVAPRTTIENGAEMFTATESSKFDQTANDPCFFRHADNEILRLVAETSNQMTHEDMGALETLLPQAKNDSCHLENPVPQGHTLSPTVQGYCSNPVYTNTTWPQTSACQEPGFSKTTYCMNAVNVPSQTAAMKPSHTHIVTETDDEDSRSFSSNNSGIECDDSSITKTSGSLPVNYPYTQETLSPQTGTHSACYQWSHEISNLVRADETPMPTWWQSQDRFQGAAGYDHPTDQELRPAETITLATLVGENYSALHNQDAARASLGYDNEFHNPTNSSSLLPYDNPVAHSNMSGINTSNRHNITNLAPEPATCYRTIPTGQAAMGYGEECNTQFQPPQNTVRPQYYNPENPSRVLSESETMELANTAWSHTLEELDSLANALPLGESTTTSRDIGRMPSPVLGALTLDELRLTPSIFH